MQVHKGLLSGTPQLSEPEKTALCWNSFLPRPALHRPPAHSPASSPCPRGSGSDSCPVNALAGRLPERPGPHPPESPSIQVGFGRGKKMWKSTYGNSSKNTISKRSWRLHLSLWTGQGGGFELQRRAGDLILGNSTTVFGGVMCH